MLIREALAKAHEAGLDLVEVAPTANPPVCRVMDFGKYKYEQNKKEHNAKTHQKAIQVKEVQFRPFISGHDLDFKVRHAKEFLEAKHKVKITLLFRGREVSLQEKGRDIMMGVIEQLKEVGTEENPLKREGRNFVMVMVPKSTKEKGAHPEKEKK